MRRLTVLLLNVIILTPFLAWAQEEKSDGAVDAQFAASPFEVGVLCGQLLPNQIDGVEEMMPLCGGRLGIKVGKTTRMEPMLVMGRAYGQKYVQGSLSFRGDSQVEDFIISFYGGPDVHYVTGADSISFSETTKIYFGGHMGGAVWIEMAKSMYLRFDMKFNLNPGTSLYTSVSLVLRMSGGGGGGP